MKRRGRGSRQPIGHGIGRPTLDKIKVPLKNKKRKINNAADKILQKKYASITHRSIGERSYKGEADKGSGAAVKNETNSSHHKETV